MRAVSVAAVLVVLALGAAACASSHASGPNQSSTNAIQLHESGYGSLPPSLQSFVKATIKDEPPTGSVNEIDVYGPGSRAALVKASSGDVVVESRRERKLRFYLVVLRGHFVCKSCSGPAAAKPPHGTIETRVWSPAEGGTDYGISSSLPAAMSRLHRLAVITLS
jgi:hypothetical protein